METERLLLLLQFWNNFTYKKEGMGIWREAAWREGGWGWQGEGKKKEGSRGTHLYN
jgi:hypothetical protein